MTDGFCDIPTWRETKRGRRCGRTCTDTSGRRRWRWTKNGNCGSPTATPQDPASTLAAALGVAPVNLEPMPLVPLVDLGAGEERLGND